MENDKLIENEAYFIYKKSLRTNHLPTVSREEFPEIEDYKLWIDLAQSSYDFKYGTEY